MSGDHTERPGYAGSSVVENLTATHTKLKDIDNFHGDDSDRKDYKFWKRTAKNFLRKTNIYTTVGDKLDYIIDNLRGPAGEKVEYRSQPGSRNAYVSADDVFADLDRIYDTADAFGDATARLYIAKGAADSLYQKDSESLDDWFGRFTSGIAPIGMGDHEMVQHAVRLMKWGLDASK